MTYPKVKSPDPIVNVDDLAERLLETYPTTFRVQIPHHHQARRSDLPRVRGFVRRAHARALRCFAAPLARGAAEYATLATAVAAADSLRPALCDIVAFSHHARRPHFPRFVEKQLRRRE
jgi:hypothetical protein